MSKLIKDYALGFTQVPNHIIDKDNRLSWKAKGLYLYLVSRPDGWNYYVQDIINRSKDGRDAVQSGLKELEDYGYLKRAKVQNEKGLFGKYIYLLKAKPEGADSD